MEGSDMKDKELEHLFDPIDELLRPRGPGAVSRRTRHTSAIPGAHDRLFVDAHYPSQIEPIDSAFMAEFRGTYGNRWKPAWSRFGHPRGGNRRHNGADIFGRVGSAVVASVKGRLTQRPASDGDDLGNRAFLSFIWAGRPHRFIYGHLERFEGADRDVAAGETIGYAGCSGNANYDGVCAGDNACGLRSSHVHLMLYDDGPGGGALDPLPALAWKVRYRDDARDVPCHEVAPSPGALEARIVQPAFAALSRGVEDLVARQGAILTQLELIERLLAAQSSAEGAAALVTWRYQLHRLLDSGSALAYSSFNVDTDKPVGERVVQFWELIRQCVDELDAGSSESLKENIRRFLLHVAFWEGDELRARVQYGNGPARSFFQFEAHRAKDALQYAKQSHNLDELARVSKRSEQELTAATGQLPSYGQPNSPYFPSGNLIEELLRVDDLFGAYLARIAFRKVPAAIPTTNAGHADYWYQYWKVTGGNPSQLKQQFRAKADRADGYIPSSFLGPYVS
jgi:hypothetical protein